MGRYVSGDFEYKFAVADQDSTLGEVLERVLSYESSYINRYIGNDAEIVRFEFNDLDKAKEEVKTFLNGFECKNLDKWCKCQERFGNEYWDKYMMSKFLEKMNQYEQDVIYQVHVEY